MENVIHYPIDNVILMITAIYNFLTLFIMHIESNLEKYIEESRQKNLWHCKLNIIEFHRYFHRSFFAIYYLYIMNILRQLENIFINKKNYFHPLSEVIFLQKLFASS